MYFYKFLIVSGFFGLSLFNLFQKQLKDLPNVILSRILVEIIFLFFRSFVGVFFGRIFLLIYSIFCTFYIFRNEKQIKPFIKRYMILRKKFLKNSFEEGKRKVFFEELKKEKK